MAGRSSGCVRYAIEPSDVQAKVFSGRRRVESAGRGNRRVSAPEGLNITAVSLANTKSESLPQPFPYALPFPFAARTARAACDSVSIDQKTYEAVFGASGLEARTRRRLK